MKFWMTSAGRKVPLNKMSNSHLSNAIRMLERKGGDSRLHYLKQEKERREALAYREKLKHDIDACAACIPEDDATRLARELRASPCGYTQKEIQQILEMQRGLIPPDAVKHNVHFLQTIGEGTPLCWIPVADVQAVVKLLLNHLPESTLRLSRAQFQAVISSLNEYVGEALDRNAKRTTTYVAEWSDTNKADEEEVEPKKK
jgi:hypothetical protein